MEIAWKYIDASIYSSSLDQKLSDELRYSSSLNQKLNDVLLYSASQARKISDLEERLQIWNKVLIHPYLVDELQKYDIRPKSYNINNYNDFIALLADIKLCLEVD